MSEAAALRSDEDHRQESELWRLFKQEGSAAAREKLFSRHAAFARNIARRHYRERAHGDIDVAELCQLAYTGLLEALDRFDPAMGTPFRAYAAHRISGSIRDGIVHMSEVREQMTWHHRLRRERMQSLVDLPEGDVSTSQAMELLADIAVGLALGFMLEGTGLFSEGEGDEASPTPAVTAYDSLAWKEVVTQLAAEVAALPDREQAILRQHYFVGASFDQLSSLMNISKGRISQLHRAALNLLRKRMSARGHFRLER